MTASFLPVIGTAPARGCDCRHCPWYTGNPGAIAGLCSGRNSDCSYCGCARTEARHPTSTTSVGSPCSTCSIRCGSRIDIGAWMANVDNTLEFDDIWFPEQRPLPELPAFIPQVDGSGTAALHAAAAWPAYALGLRRLISPATGQIYPRFRTALADGRSAAEVLDLPIGPGAPAVVLVGYAEDPLVETVWTRRHSHGLLEAIAALKFDVVLAPNFSLYGNYPRAEMLLNLRRNLLIASELYELGVTAVPNLYGFRAEDFQRYSTWLHDLDPTDWPPALAMNLQTFRTDHDWSGMAVPALAYLATTLPPQLPVLLTGPSRPDRVQLLHRLFGNRLRLIAQNPAQFAQHGALMSSEGRLDVHARREDLFARNVAYLHGLLTTDPKPASES